MASAAFDGHRPRRLVAARRDTPFSADERALLTGMARILGLALRGVAAQETERVVRERHRLLEVLLDIQRSISHRKPLSDVLAAITAGASGLLGGCPVALVLDDPLDPERPIVAATTGGGDRSESELAIVATAAARSASAPSVDTALAASVHINGARAGALVAMAPTGLDDDQLGMLDAFAEHASLALTDARTVEAMQEAFHDSLTGLPNRALFLDRLQHALDVAARRRTELCVLFVDLDRFKAVNDSIGHAAGDALLRAVADRLAECTRAADTAARFGGDEFAVLLEDDGRGVRPEAVADRIIAAMRRPFDVEGKEVFIGATVGIAHAHDASLGPDELLRNADLAMYRAKKAGGNRAATYETAMRTALLARIELEADLRHALERDELRLAYQPVVELQGGRAVGVEALVRWAHPTRGLIAPLTFIPVAEEIGMIGAIGRWVLREACRQLAAWRRIAPELVLNVNLSPLQLRDDRLAIHVQQALRAHALPGAALDARDHREHAALRRRGHRGPAAPAQGARRVDRRRRLRHRLLLAELPQAVPGRRAEDRQELRRHRRAQHRRQRAGAHDRRARTRHAPGDDRRGHRDRRAARAAAPARLPARPGLPLLGAAGRRRADDLPRADLRRRARRRLASLA